MTSYCSKDKALNPLYTPPNQHCRLYLPVQFLPIRITSQRDPIILNSSSLCYSYTGLPSNPPTHTLSPAIVFAHANDTFPDLVNFFLQTYQRSIYTLYHHIEPCTHISYTEQTYSLLCAYLISVPRPPPITSTTKP